MLAMLSALVLQTNLGADLTPSRREKNIIPAVPRMANVDYFSLTKSTLSPSNPASPEWPRLPSSVASSTTSSFSSSNSSRGSWSSLFNTGTMRQFMNGMQGSLKEGLSAPTEIVPSHGIPIATTKSTEKSGRTGLDLTLAQRKRGIRQEFLLHTQALTMAPKPSNDTGRQPSKGALVSVSAASHRQLRFADSNSFMSENQVVVFEPDSHEDM